MLLTFSLQRRKPPFGVVDVNTTQQQVGFGMRRMIVSWKITSGGVVKSSRPRILKSLIFVKLVDLLVRE